MSALYAQAPARRRSWGGFALMLGAALTLAILGVALLSQIWTPADPTTMQMALRFKPPLEGGWLGNDQLGRDVASALMIGAWNSLSIALTAVAWGALLGVMLGLTAAMIGGWLDALLMRGCDILFALPPILSAILLGAYLGAGQRTAILAIGVFMIPVFARMTRGAARQIERRDYIQAARMAGRSRAEIAATHVLPNIAGVIAAQLAIQTGLAILTEAGLSFLGLGLAPPNPSWGRMLADSQTYLTRAPHLAWAPGLAVAMTVLAFNLLGDGLAAWLDPRRSAQAS